MNKGLFKEVSLATTAVMVLYCLSSSENVET